ncbi:MAG: serpin family protein [Firmicutes bacterium]|nr:serpin family protein [[Eubacterium] siraeum]MCM1489132.1 serpin family protein [Bacillota bacterium]
MKKLLSLILCGIMAVSATGCTQNIKAEEEISTLKADVKTPAEGLKIDDKFKAADMRFSVELFKEAYGCSKGKNVLVSPLSVYPALAMTANGADKETLAEMERVLGGDLTADLLNRYLSEYLNGVKAADEVDFHIANSIWLREDPSLDVNKDFLQVNTDYYDSEIYKAPFDSSTVDKINGWVKENTHEMIPEIIDRLDSTAMMCLINALAFEAKWEEEYEEDSIHDGIFTNSDKTYTDVQMMRSTEYEYLEGEDCTGFIKNYLGGEYAFAALLPHEGVALEDFLGALTDEKLSEILNNVQKNTEVYVGIPEFKCEYGASLKDMLAAMGMTAAFDPYSADFGKMATVNGENSLYIGDVIHKTYIEVDRKGTKAAAATAVIIAEGCAIVEEPPKSVVLERPFLYMILDKENDLPVFIGAVNSL